jgi:hypothetical protein
MSLLLQPDLLCNGFLLRLQLHLRNMHENRPAKRAHQQLRLHTIACDIAMTQRSRCMSSAEAASPASSLNISL